MHEYSRGRKGGNDPSWADQITALCSASLTGCGDEFEEQLFGEQGVLETPEVQLQHAGHRVQVTLAV